MTQNELNERIYALGELKPTATPLSASQVIAVRKLLRDFAKAITPTRMDDRDKNDPIATAFKEGRNVVIMTVELNVNDLLGEEGK